MSFGKIRSHKLRNNPAALAAKVAIRKNVLEAVGPGAAVFEAFAGRGTLYREVWSRAGSYVGCDLEFVSDGRLAFAADNRRVMRCINLDKFQIIDLDAFGSPWEQALIVAVRRKLSAGEVFGLVLTDGSGLKLKCGALPKALAYLAGVSERLSGVCRWQDDLTDRALHGVCRMMGAKIERRWQAKGRTGASMIYTGLVLRGLSGAEAGEADYDSRRVGMVAGRA